MTATSVFGAFFMQKTVLTNHEYDALLKCGGDGLIAVFCHLRFYKTDTVYYKEGRAGVYGMLTKRTGLSRNTLKKHLPMLMDLGIVCVHENGNVAITGRKSSGRLLERKKTTKYIPIEIGPKFTDTKTNVYFVRVHSNLRGQEKQIAKKSKRIELLNAEPRTLKEHKAKERLLKKTSIDEIKNSYRENGTISNCLFDALKKCDPEIIKSTARGNYQKRKLVSKGDIGQQRQVFLLMEGCHSYCYMREVRQSLCFGGVFMGNKGIYFESSPTIYLCSA